MLNNFHHSLKVHNNKSKQLACKYGHSNTAIKQ